MKESIKKKFDSIDQSKIKVESTKELLAKIEKALNGKIEENADKAEALLDKFIAQAKAKNADIFVSKKAEPTLTPTEKKKATQVVKSKLETLMDTIANDPLLKDFNNSRRSKGGGKSDPLIDSERKAIQSGPRVSKKGWKNQYGKSTGGRKYYEYRENRIDRKAPNYGSRPWLKEGGFIHPSDANADKYVVVEIKADGSRREHNNFGDLETARMFASLKREFLPKGSQLMIEDKNGKNLYRSFKSGGRVDESTAMVLSQNKAIAHHTEELKKAISKNEKVEPWVVGKMQRASTDISDVTHYFDGMTEYASGGMMADGGEMQNRRTLKFGDAVLYKDEMYEFVKKDGEVGFVSHSQGAWGMNGRFLPLGRMYRSDLEENLTDMYGNKFYIPNYEDLMEMPYGFAKGGKVKGGTLEDVRKDAKTASRNSKQDAYVIEDKHYEFANGNKSVITRFTWANQEDVDYIKEIRKQHLEGSGYYWPANNTWISSKIIGKYSDGELKSSEQEILIGESGMMADGGEIEGVDLFEDYEDQPKEVEAIISKYEIEDYNYDVLQKMREELESIGYTMDFGLDAEPYDLRKIGEKGKSEFYAKGGKIKTKPIINQYEGRLYDDIWNNWTENQRYNFIEAYKLQIEKRVDYKRDIYSNEFPKRLTNQFITTAYGSNWKDLDESVKNIFMRHVNKGQFANGGMMADGGKVRWQDVYVGDNALVIAENKMGMVVKPYGRRFHLKFPDGSEKTYSAEELEFFKDEEFAKGGKTPTGDYVKRKDIKLIYVKNPNKNGSNKFLKIDKSDFLDGLHKMSEGGKLTDEYTYIKRSDVTDVVYRDDQTSFASDRKPQNGFWVSKKALIDAGMNATENPTTKLDFGTTSLRKGENGWKAKNSVNNYKGYDWEITTMKSMRGDLVSTAVGGKNEKGGSGYTMFTYVMYQDPNIRLMTSKPSRITDKAVAEQHKKALELFESKVGEKYAKGGMLDRDNDAKKLLNSKKFDAFYDKLGVFTEEYNKNEIAKILTGKGYNEDGGLFFEIGQNNKYVKYGNKPYTYDFNKVQLDSDDIEEIERYLGNWPKATIMRWIEKPKSKPMSEDGYAKGGMMAKDGQSRSYKTFVEEYPDKQIYVRVKFAGADKDVQRYTANEENKKRAIGFAKRLAEKNNGTYEGFNTYTLAKGGMMAKGGSTSNGSKLPEEMGRYFTKPRGTKVISMSSIIPLRARAEGIANAEKNMKMAYDGKMEKRKPITLYKSQGKYRVYDGNSTYAVAKANGWENIWAEVIKNPNMNTYDKRGNDIFTKAKAIRKEGEAWKDALQRAKAMK